MRRGIATAGILAAALTLGAVAATALAGPRSHSAPTAGQAQVNISFAVTRFVRRGRTIVAQGAVTATYRDSSGLTKSTKQPFQARVRINRGRRLAASSVICRVLYLQLDKLSLTLLGLDVNLDKVVLTIDGNSKGGALGSLFCALARTKVSLRGLSASAARMTQAVRSNRLGSGFGFAVPLTGTQQQVASAIGTCQVLDLVLGPLQLNLLGLLVHLNQVHLTLTATPGAVLGNLFCTLAGGPSGTSATTTTTP